MLIHLFNLLGRSIEGFPTVLSSNWLSILLPLIIFLIIEGIFAIGRHRKGIPWIDPKMKNDNRFRITMAVLTAIYIVLFCFSVAKTAYIDHMYLSAKATEFRERIQRNGNQFQTAILKLQVDCARQQGIVDTLQKQNIDQQGTINNCQTQAIKLLNPAEQETRVFVIETFPNRKPQGVEWVLITNRPVTPVEMKVECNREIGMASLSALGSDRGTSLTNIRISRSSLIFQRIDSPVWSPTQPLVAYISFMEDVSYPPTCKFSKR